MIGPISYYVHMYLFCLIDIFCQQNNEYDNAKYFIPNKFGLQIPNLNYPTR